MKITPIDIEAHSFAIKFRGFDPEEVRSFLNIVSQELEGLVTENSSLKERLAQVEASVADFKERERILKETLLTVQKISEEIKEEARREAQLIVKEAEVKGSQLLDRAAHKASEMEGVIQTLRMERVAFEQRIRSAIEQHLRLLEMHKDEEEVEDRLHFMKKPQSEKAS